MGFNSPSSASAPAPTRASDLLAENLSGLEAVTSRLLDLAGRLGARFNNEKIPGPSDVGMGVVPDANNRVNSARHILVAIADGLETL
jgi:hypothetical protein